MHSRSPGDRERGSITAEFAAVLPAVFLVLIACIGGMQVAGRQLLLQDAAADAARIVARGEPTASAEAHARRLVAGASVQRYSSGGLDCVAVSAPAAGSGPLAALALAANACALGAGW